MGKKNINIMLNIYIIFYLLIVKSFFYINKNN